MNELIHVFRPFPITPLLDKIDHFLDSFNVHFGRSNVVKNDHITRDQTSFDITLFDIANNIVYVAIANG